MSWLVPVLQIPSVPRYREQGLPGVPAQCWLAEPTLARLTQAATALAEEGLGLCIWDAWRSGATQQALADRYVRELVAEGVPESDARAGINTFVASPDGPYPHGTGGAVDLRGSANRWGCVVVGLRA